MSTSVELHIRRYPNCRTTSIACKIKQDAMTEQLRREILAAENKTSKHIRELQWWRRFLVALRGEANG